MVVEQNLLFFTVLRALIFHTIGLGWSITTGVPSRGNIYNFVFSVFSVVGFDILLKSMFP